MALKLKTYLKRQKKIVDGLPEQFYGRVKRQQRKLLEEIEDLIDDFQLDDQGNIIASPSNLALSEQITTRLRVAFFNEDYVRAVADLAEGFDRAAVLNEQWLSGVLGTDLGADITESAQLLLQRQKSNAVELLVGNSAIDSAFFTPIEQSLIDGVRTGESIRQLRKNLRETIVGSSEVDGRLLRYAKQISNDAIATGDRNYMDNIAKNAGVEFYQYVGGTIGDTRDFCLQRNGKFFHKKEIEAWGSVPAKWQGRFRGTNSSTIFTWLGGYNCRHSIIPVSAISVPKEVLIRNLNKGFYKPSQAEKDRIGIAG